MPFVFAIALALAWSTSAAAQATPANPTGTYNVEWARVTTYISPDLTTGSGVMTVTALTPADPEAEPSWTLGGVIDQCYVWRSGEVQCGDGIGTLTWYDYPGADGTLDTFWFDMELFGGGNVQLHTLRVGTKRVAASRTVTITSPTAGQTVSDTAPIGIQTQGFTGSRSYVLLVDGVQRQFGTTSADSFTLWFNTTRVATGGHTFTVRITQSGQTLSAQVQVTVQNP